MKVLITGKTGLVGSAIEKQLLKEGHTVHYLTIQYKKIRYSKHSIGFMWDPSKQKIDHTCLNGVDTIIHLSGASVSNRWTNTYKKEILDSRLEGTQLLYETLKKHPHQVKQIIAASAVGIYPNSLDTTYTENQTVYDTSFLGQVSQQWEASIDQFKLLNITTCILRIGIVFSKKGGALQEMIKPIKLGLGSTFGRGKQIQSWIHIDDLAAIFIFVRKNNLSGVYNAVAPQPSTNKVVTETIAAIMNKPLLLPGIPKFIMKIILGEMHELLYVSQNVSCQKIINQGFNFTYEKVEDALQDILAS